MFLRTMNSFPTLALEKIKIKKSGLDLSSKEKNTQCCMLVFDVEKNLVLFYFYVKLAGG